MTPEDWELLKPFLFELECLEFRAVLGRSIAMSTEFYVANERYVSKERLMSNSSIPDSFFYENPRFVTNIVSKCPKRSVRFYQTFAEILGWKEISFYADLPSSFWIHNASRVDWGYIALYNFKVPLWLVMTYADVTRLDLSSRPDVTK